MILDAAEPRRVGSGRLGQPRLLDDGFGSDGLLLIAGKPSHGTYHMAMHSEGLNAGSKSQLRAAVLQAREAVPAAEWRLEDAARLRHIVAHLPHSAGTVALYAARHGEPGTHDLIDALGTLGWRVLLPVLRRQPDWADFTSWDDMRPRGRHPGADRPTAWPGVTEPGRPDPGALPRRRARRFPARHRRRLVRQGAPHRRDDARIVAISRAPEVFASVPMLPHDVPVGAFVTETGWVDL
ncbi:hypothetical protein G7085_07070 [Tessaracoccus sp. HDW20]|nr:5-formyltetrahydrofolate cyclo-ligase [Tessaracoccus coleopterorum]NHB84448.1 hypothetical protein [Tessaracoccus coleopterorum]